jgi:NodT family efflux transporter outer membrane factor (OMF) lipoprotein
VDIAALREALALTRHQLAALLGAGPDRGLAVERPSFAVAAAPALPSALPADLLGRRPDVAASRARVEAALHDVAVAKADFYPNVDLRAFAGFASLGLSDLVDARSRVAGAGPALRLPIFDRKLLKNRLAAQTAEYDAAVAQYDETLIEALRDTSDRVASMRSIAEQRAEQDQALAAASEAYGLALARYRDGVGNYLSVLTVETEVLAQRRLAADLRARGYEVQIELIRALGGGFDAGIAISSAAAVRSTTRRSS